MRFTKILSLALALLVPCVALGHDDAYLDSLKAPNGGQIRMAGSLHLELVAKPGELAVYLYDHANAKLPAAGASGSATVLSGKTRETVALSPAGDNLLKGTGKFGLAPDMKVVVSVTLPGKSAETARFTPLAKAQAAK